MSTRYRLMMYERATEEFGGAVDVRPHFQRQVLSLAGLSRVTEPGETELTDDQARAITSLLNIRVNVPRYIYTIETLVTSQDRLRA